MASIAKRLRLPRSQIHDWFLLSRKRLWERGVLTSGWTQLEVAVGKIAYQGNGRTSTGRETHLRTVVTVRSDEEHLLDLTTTPDTTVRSKKSVLPRPKRGSYLRTRAVPSWRLGEPETDPIALDQFLEAAWVIFDQAAEDIRQARRSTFIVGIFFRSGNWPLGRTEFGPYTLCSVGEQESFVGTHILLARRVDGFTKTACREDWHGKLTRIVTMIAVLTGRDVVLAKRVPETVRNCIPNLGSHYPVVENNEKSALLAFASEVRPAPCSSPYSPVSVPPLGFVPDDLGLIIERYESLEDERRAVIDDGLTMLRLVMDYRRELPTVALSACWFALERLVDCVRAIPKDEAACPECGQKKARSQQAILDLMQSLLRLTDGQRGEVAHVLSAIRRDFRISFVHRARLPGGDLLTPAEVWAASGEKEAPGHARVADLLPQAEDFVHSVLIAILEGVRDGQKPAASG